ncbi:MAG TPA: M48 family metallopeptidase [Pyrinomonadaceae bacterium]|jgi:predicted Zn-dependent protease|nr:M48 family metallopeptidase [Pyrinomonadaceae bacterium]
MTNIGSGNGRRLSALMLAFVLLALPLVAVAQTQIVAPKNKYSTSDDVRLGQQAAQQVYQQMPVLRDTYVRDYVNSVGRRLAAAIPPEYQHPEFRYTFDVIDARDINAFSLPGGAMFVNRGMIEAADTEGMMAGVMAHEMSHVALRHVTAQATETQKYQVLSGVGQIAGAILGGVGGAVLGAGSQLGGGLVITKFSRGYEKQADLLGAQIMARAGYDPRDLARMFQKIEQQGGASGPQWLSDHPNPGNRYQYIMQEAAMLRVNPDAATRDTRQFLAVKEHLGTYPRARTMEEIARSGQRYPNQGGQYPSQGGQYPDRRNPNDYGTARGERVAYPSTSYVTQRTDLFSVAIPSNWQSLGGDQTSVSYAPEGGYGSQGITHGVMFSVAQSNYSDLRGATDEIVQGLLQSNNYLRQAAGYQRTTVDGRDALAATLTGRSPITGRDERVTVVATALGNGQVFYMAAVSPQTEYATYQRTFNDILRSLRLNSRY